MVYDQELEEFQGLYERVTGKLKARIAILEHALGCVHEPNEHGICPKCGCLRCDDGGWEAPNADLETALLKRQD